MAEAPVVEDGPADACLRAFSLVRLGQFDRHDPGRGGHAARLRQGVGDERDLRGRQRVEPMHRTRGRLRAYRGLHEKSENEKQAQRLHGVTTAVCCDGRLIGGAHNQATVYRNADRGWRRGSAGRAGSGGSGTTGPDRLRQRVARMIRSSRPRRRFRVCSEADSRPMNYAVSTGRTRLQLIPRLRTSCPASDPM